MDLALTLGGTMDLKAQHDDLLANQPSGVIHNAEECQFCNPELGGDMSGTYTEDELKSAVEEAVAKALAPFQEEAALEALQKAVDEAVATALADMEQVQNALDTATLRAEKAEKDLDEIKSWLDEEEAKAAAEAALTAKKSERLEAVKDLGFKQEWIEERLDRWTAMDDESFAELVDVFKAATAGKEGKDVTPTAIPDATAMTAGSEGDRKGGDKFATMREVSRLGLMGVDIRRVV